MTSWYTYIEGLPRHSRHVVQQYTARGDWGSTTIFEAFRQSAELHASKVAVIDGDTRITYSELLDRVDRVASGLHTRGIKRGHIVAAQLPNWAEFIEFALACTRLGAILSPLNHRLRGEVQYALRTAESPLIVIPAEFHDFDYHKLVESLRDELPSLRQVIITRTAQADGPDTFDVVRSSPPTDLPPLPDANDPWALIFTSGTTAAPKGVVRTHNNTLFTLRALTDFYGLATPSGDDVALAVLPITFIFPFYLCVLMPLVNGLTVVLQEAFDPEETLELISRHRVTLLAIVPSMVERLLEARQRDKWDLTSLRVIQPAGEVVSEERKARLMRELDCDVREVFGLAECTWPIGHPPSSPVQKKLAASGLLCPGVELKIVDDEYRDVGTGEVGEIAFRGPNLFPGYYRNPDATRAAIDDQGWFFTGDLGTCDADGYLRIVGRNKDTIIRGGINILPQEIEEWLGGHPKVDQVAVFGVPHPRTGEQVWACVVGRPGTRLTSDELLAFLRGKVASFKLPERVFIVDELPLSNVGKVLRRELKERMMSDFGAESAS